MTTYTIELTETEELAFQYVAQTANSWIQHAVHERARVAIEEIIQISIPQFLNNNVQIPSTKEAIVQAAYDNGYIKTGAERFAESSNNSITPNLP